RRGPWHPSDRRAGTEFGIPRRGGARRDHRRGRKRPPRHRLPRAPRDRLALDIGSLALRERYERWRRFDTFEMGLITDGLNRLFSNDNPALRLLRDVGLRLVDRLPARERMCLPRGGV